MSKDVNSNSAHNRAIEALSAARQHVRQYVFELERSNVPPGQIFVATDSPDHPQKSAHAALLDFYHQINNVEYISRFDQEWQADFTDAAGNDLTVDVPKADKVTKTVDEQTGVDNMIPDLSTLETREETCSLEMLGYRWGTRTVTVEAKVDSPYRDADKRVETVRLWLPPVFIKAAYSKINDCLSMVNLLAKMGHPVESDPDPI